MRHRSLFSDEGDRVEINLSPMIDCIFILLIFFIVTTVFVEETGVSVQRPEAASAVSLEKNSILVAITADGRIFYGGQEIGVSGVAPTVRRLLARRSMPVIIQSDKSVPHGLFARVYGEARLAGAQEISFSTLH